MKQIWRNLNQACSLSTTKENKGITELSDNGENIADNLLMSNVLNKYFATVGGSLPKKLQNNSPNSFISFKNYFDSPSKNSILVYPVSWGIKPINCKSKHLKIRRSRQYWT